MIDPAFVLLSGLTWLALDPEISADDLRPFPPTSTVNAALEANDRARKLIEGRLSADLIHRDHWRAALAEVKRAEFLWRCLELARRTDNPEWQESLLRHLRWAIGNRDYYAGAMPCPVPLWAFPRTDEANPTGHVPIAAPSVQ